eukprot:4767963-Amphidinium_carterae.1
MEEVCRDMVSKVLCVTCHTFECCCAMGAMDIGAQNEGEEKQGPARKRPKAKGRTLVLAESFLAMTTLLALSGMPSWTACQPAKQVSPIQREHWASMDPDLLIMHTEALEVTDWNPNLARKVHASTGQLVQMQEAAWEQMERGGLVAIVHR